MKKHATVLGELFAIGIILFVISCVAAECRETALAQAPAADTTVASLVDVYTLDDEALARLRVHEAGWPSPYTPTNDGGMIGQYVLARARQRNVTVAEYIARVHHRHTAPTSRRPWVRGLNRTMQRPEGWPEDSVPWFPRGHDNWKAALAEAHEVLEGRFAPCAETPHAWGGPTVDRERIARILANGGRVIDCGNTRNTPLRFR